jgi:glycosyltransferase involved in cell wall biosynthesis
MKQSSTNAPLPDGFGINLIGYFSADKGLGNTARAYAEALRRHGVPFVVGNVGNAQDAENTNRDWHGRYVKHARGMRHPLNLYILHSDLKTVWDANPWMLAPGRMHVAMLWWETTVLPNAWIPQLSMLDGIVACTPFIANVAANHLALVPVIQSKHPLDLPSDVRPDRRRFGVPDGTFLLTSSFNPTSDPARKNPVAQVRAFRQAFARDIDDVQFLIRVHHAGSGQLARESIKAIVEAADGDGRIRLVTEPLSYRDVLSFYATGDAYVSLHRAEGLGLGLMEAMALGKPVIATGWSGNMGFMDQSCACLVRYHLGPVRGNYPYFQREFLGPQALWALPVFEDAAAWMRQLHASPDLRRRIGAAAKARIETYQEEAWGRRWLDELVALWETRDFLPTAMGKHSSPPARA